MVIVVIHNDVWSYVERELWSLEHRTAGVEMFL